MTVEAQPQKRLRPRRVFPSTKEGVDEILKEAHPGRRMCVNWSKRRHILRKEDPHWAKNTNKSDMKEYIFETKNKTLNLFKNKKAAQQLLKIIFIIYISNK